ncbi:hypothetical protein TSMEX_000313 [Taenia solium]|eukprot:TsM_000440200 transcript=TsM_000440200 gene=TsM_000440200
MQTKFNTSLTNFNPKERNLFRSCPYKPVYLAAEALKTLKFAAVEGNLRVSRVCLVGGEGFSQIMLGKVSKLAKLLASDELKTRRRGYKCVCELLSLEPGSNQFDMSFKDMLGVCKGLYYSLWMQDKLLLQEESAARIAKLISTSKSRGTRSMYIKAMFETLAREWDNLDTWREDKFMMLARVFFVRCIGSIKRRKVAIETLANAVFEGVINANTNSAIGLKLHLCLVIQQELLNAGLPLNKISDELLVSSTKNVAHRKVLRRIALMLYTKKSKASEEQRNSIGNPSPLNDAGSNPTVAPPVATTTSTRKRMLKEDFSENLEASPDINSHRPKWEKKADAREESSPILSDQKLESQRTAVVDGGIKGDFSVAFSSAMNGEPGGVATKSEFDLSVMDQASLMPEKKRVSFGKVVCRRFSVHRISSVKNITLTKPDRSILRH